MDCTKFSQFYLIRQTYWGTCLRILYKIGRHQDNEEERKQTNSSRRRITSIEDPVLMVYRKSPYTRWNNTLKYNGSCGNKRCCNKRCMASGGDFDFGPEMHRIGLGGDFDFGPSKTNLIVECWREFPTGHAAIWARRGRNNERREG